MIGPAFRRLALAAALGLTGCVFAQTSNGTGLTGLPIDQIQPGTTTKADITRMFGPPDEIIYSNLEHDPLFEQAYRYRRTRGRQTGLFLLIFSTYNSDTKWDHLMVFFDKNGVVEHMGVKLDADKAEYGMPF